MPNVIGLVGRKGAGKDTVGKILVDDYGFTRVAFADKVKEVCKIVFDLTDAELSDPLLKETPLQRWPFETPRSIMQRVGTECFRTYWPEVWIEAVKRKLDTEDLGDVVITDVRFENELFTARTRGGINVRVDASDRIDAPRDNHASEDVDGLHVQYTLNNNGTPEDLAALVAQMMSEAFDG